MKTLYESLLDIDQNHDNDILINLLFSKDIQQRRDAFSTLLKMIESYRPRQHKTVAKMKNSDSYFVQFTRPIKVENGEATNEVLDWISDVIICKQNESLYKNIVIGAYSDGWGSKISAYELSWRHTQQHLNPKASNTKLYEVPKELNELFKQIQIEASNHKKL